MSVRIVGFLVCGLALSCVVACTSPSGSGSGNPAAPASGNSSSLKPERWQLPAGPRRDDVAFQRGCGQRRSHRSRRRAGHLGDRANPRCDNDQECHRHHRRTDVALPGRNQLRDSCRVDYKVTIPARVAVDIEGAAGDIMLTGPIRTATVKTAAARITGSGLGAGTFQVTTTAGEVQLAFAAAPTSVRGQEHRRIGHTDRSRRREVQRHRRHHHRCPGRHRRQRLNVVASDRCRDHRWRGDREERVTRPGDPARSQAPSEWPAGPAHCPGIARAPRFGLCAQRWSTRHNVLGPDRSLRTAGSSAVGLSPRGPSRPRPDPQTCRGSFDRGSSNSWARDRLAREPDVLPAATSLRGHGRTPELNWRVVQPAVDADSGAPGSDRIWTRSHSRLAIQRPRPRPSSHSSFRRPTSGSSIRPTSRTSQKSAPSCRQISRNPNPCPVLKAVGGGLMHGQREGAKVPRSARPNGRRVTVMSAPGPGSSASNRAPTWCAPR